MFSKIVVALNDLPESQRALHAAIDLARACNAELATVSILGDLPAYTLFATFPNRVCHGKVEQLSPASSSQFAPFAA